MILYLLAIYFIIHDKINGLYSLFSITFLIVYTTFKSLDLEAPVPILCNFFLIIAQILNILIPKNKKKTLLPTPPNPDILQHIFNVAFPGLVFLFKKKENLNNSDEKFEIELSFINQKAMNYYNITNMQDFYNFIDEIVFIKDYNNNENKKKSDFLITSAPTPMGNFKEEIMRNLNEIMKNTKEENLIDLTENSFVGLHYKKNMKLRVFLTGFLHENNIESLLLIDDNKFGEDYNALKELDEKKDKMLIAITHDLRSPLNGILAFINLAKTEMNLENRNKKLTFAEINGNLLMSLIEDILDFQSIAQNKFNLKGEEFNLNSVLEEIVDLISMQTKEKNINFQLYTNFAKNHQIILFSDSRRLKQILLNLLTNSIKFTMNGGKLRLNVYGTIQPNLIKFEIIDSGIGIKPEIIEKLGEPFNTFDTNGLNKYGIGFGLYLCKKLSELLGPKEKNFHISSIYGKGSKIGFLIYIKLQELEKQTISYKKLFYQQVSEHSMTNKAIGYEYEKFIKSNSKNLKNSISRNDPLKRSQFSKHVFSLHEFDDLSLERKFSSKVDKLMTEIHLKKDISKDYNHEKPAINEITEENLMNYFNSKTRTISWGLSKEISFNGINKKLRGSLDDFSLSKKDISVIYDESLEFIPFSEEELNKNVFYEEIEEREELSEKGFMKNVESLSQYNFQPKFTLRKLNNVISDEKSIMLDKPVCNVLIVDDNAFNLLVLYEFLKRIPMFEIHIDKASNGAECLEMFKKANKLKTMNNYEIIFMDCFMPIKDGYETSTEIKRLINEEKYSEVIIIAVTGLSGLDEENKCKQSGMDDFMMKPVSEKELTELFMFYMRQFMND